MKILKEQFHIISYCYRFWKEIQFQLRGIKEREKGKIKHPLGVAIYSAHYYIMQDYVKLIHEFEATLNKEEKNI